MKYIILLLIGIIIGIVITYLLFKRKLKPSGTFVIDLSDPMKDICRFELGESLDSLYSKKQVIFNVQTYGEFSSK